MPSEGRWPGKANMKIRTVIVTALALFILPVAANADSAPLPKCDETDVQQSLQDVARISGGGMIVKVIQISEVSSPDPTQRRCRAEVVSTFGSLHVLIYNLSSPSETDRRYWLQVEDERPL